MDNDQKKPQTMEELQAEVARLEALVAAKNKPATKGIELLVEHATGYVQIRRLMPLSLNLPTWVIRWILTNSKRIAEFMSANQSLLIEQNDSDEVLAKKLAARTANLSSENPVVRKPRAKNEPATE